MKALKLLLVILGVLVALFILLGLIGPKENNVSRTVSIDAPPAFVFPYISQFERMNAWSPWAERDPDQETMIEGTDGTVGAVFSWEGNEDVGKGSQEITAIVPNESVQFDLNFAEPFESQAQAWTEVEENAEGGSNVTWGFKSQNGFMERVMFLFMDMDKMLGPDYEKGLNMLKDLVEADYAAAANSSPLEVTTIDFPGQAFITVRETMGWDQMQAFFAENFGKLFGAAADKVAGMPSALYYTWDEENQQTDMAAAVPVSAPVPGYDLVELPAGKALQVNYFGAYEGVGDAHMAIDGYMKANGMTAMEPVIEQYVTDPGAEPDTSKWLTKVTYLIQE